MASIKKFHAKYFDGKIDCKGCKGCSEGEILACYIMRKKGFVDDRGKELPEKETYIRDKRKWCCGAKMKQFPDTEDMICEICGKIEKGKS